MSEPTASSRSTRKGGNGRAGRDAYDLPQVLEIAVAAFNEYGYDATSMGILAERLGTSKSAIYYHVTGKEDLLRLALERGIGELEKVLDEPEAKTGSAADRLRFVLAGAVRVLVDDLPFVTLLLRVRGNSDIERSALDRRRKFDHAISRLVDKARDEGSLRADVDSAVTTRLLFGMINSIVEWYKPGGSLTAQQLTDDVLTVAFDGLTQR